MTHIPYAGGTAPRSKTVWFESPAEGIELLPGDILCYDIAAPLVPDAGDFPEKVRGTQCVRPATANLSFVAGIVKKGLKYRGKQGNEPFTSHFVEIYVPRKGEIVGIRCNANLTANATLIKAVNGEFYGVNSATLITAAPTVPDIAVSLETLSAGTTTMVAAMWLQ
jgi:hypothetical protein